MDRIEQLHSRKETLEKLNAEIFKQISQLSDEDSFVELGAFSFSGKPFYGEEGEGEGVVTGFFTAGGYPFYLVAQNFGRDFGGLTKGNCEKIARLLSAAEKNETPVVWLLNCRGVKLGEGVNVLEGISELLLRATQLRGTVPQYAVIGGEVYGAAAAIAAISDVVFFLGGSALAVTSPLVLSAKSGKNLKKEEVGGYEVLGNTLLPAVKVKDLEEVGAHLKNLTELFGEPMLDAELNESIPALNGEIGAKELAELIEDGLELGQNGVPEVKTVLGRIGGIAVAAVIFDNAKLNAQALCKVKNFAALACDRSLPFVTFVDCTGVEESLAVNDSAVLKEIGEYLSTLNCIDTAKIAVVTGKAVGLGYSLFAAKSAGFDCTYALATAQISLFESEKGAEIFYGSSDEALLERYGEEHADPVQAACGGYLDNVIEPQFLKQYLIASLQMLLR